MTPHKARILLVLTGTALAGYSLRWFLAAWGWTPVICLTVFGVTGFAIGWMLCWRVLSDETATANRERDDLAARLAQLLDGGVYKPMAAHPSFRSKLTSVPKQAER